MRILKPGEPCPCCGQPIKEGLPTETMILLSWLQDGKELLEATGEFKENSVVQERWKDWLKNRFEQGEV